MQGKKVLKYGLLGLCVLIVALVAGLYFAAPSILEKVLVQANEASQKSTGRSLTFSRPPSISIMPLGVSFEGVRWGDDASDLSVYARSGHARVRLGSIFSGTPEVTEVDLQGPVVTIREAASQTALGPVPDTDTVSGRESVQDQTAETSGGTGPLPVQLRRLVLQDGQFTFVQAAGDQIVLSKINLSVRNIGQGQTGDLECDFVAAVQRASGEYMEANLAIQGSALTALPEISLNNLKVTLAPVTGLYDKNLGPSSLSVTGNFNLDTHAVRIGNLDVQAAGAKMVVRGEGTLADAPAFAGDVAVEASPAKMSFLQGVGGIQNVSLKARAEFANNILNIPSLQVVADKAKMDGSLNVPLAPLTIRGRLHCRDIDVNALMKGQGRSAGDSGKKDGKAVQSGEAQKTANPAASWPEVDLALDAKAITYNGVSMSNLSLTVAGKDGSYTVSPLVASVDGAKVDVMAALDLKKEQWQSSGSVTELPLATVQKLAAKDFGMSGSSTMNWNITAKGGDADAIMKSAAGKGQVVLTGVTIAAITRAIRNTKQLATVALPERVDRVTVPYTLANGNCRFTLTISSSTLTGSGQGNLNYVGQRIDATAEVKVQGVTVPLKINGPLSDVSYSVDMERLLKNMGKGVLDVPQHLKPEGGLKNVLPKSGNPLKGLF